MSVPVGTTLSRVAASMRDERVGTVVVTEGEGEYRRVVGIITDRDIVRTQLRRTADLSSLNASEAMTANPLVIPYQESIEGAIAHLKARGVRRAPVVTHDGKLVGVVSVDDLLAHVARQIIGMASIVVRQVRTEDASLSGRPHSSR